VIKWSDLDNGCNNPGITAQCILRRQEGQHADGNFDGQLKVGPIHQVPARVPATNGESLESVIILHCSE
jgi:hypothetical protein